MKLGILSDTHMILPLPEFKKWVDRHFRDVDKILHLGDFTEPGHCEISLGPERIDRRLWQHGSSRNPI